jgi:urease accessory protein
MNVKLIEAGVMRRLLMLVLVAAPAIANAHDETGQAAGLLSGLLHPISGLDHVLAMIAVGLWAAMLGTPAIRVLPIAFPLAMAFGGLLGLFGIALPSVELGIALSAVVLGTMVLARFGVSPWMAATIVALFAVFHGHAHGSELPQGTSALLYSVGFVIATALLHALGILLGVAHRWTAGRRIVRAAGGGVALAGLFFLWRAVV